MAIRIILNPNADLGHGADRLALIEETASALWQQPWRIVQTERPGHAYELAADAIAAGCDTLVAAGGDGTIHEVVNAVFLNGHADRIRLGIVPLGTGNDFAHAMGIPMNDVPGALAIIAGGVVRLADLAEVIDDHGRREVFENNFGIGFDANVVIRTSEITHLRGFVKYFVGVLTTLYKDFDPIQLRLRFDDEEVNQEVLFLSLGLGPRHGGGFMLTPGALHEDDLVDSCTVSMIGRLKAVSLLSAAMKGTHITEPIVDMRRNREIIISADQPLPIHIDGEVYATLADNVRQLQITSIPSVLRVLVEDVSGTNR